MSRKKRMQSVREAKDRRAKKIAIGGGVLLAILLAWEVPHYLGGGKKAATPPAPASTTDSGTTPATTTPATTPTGVAVAASTPATSTKLPNSDMTPKHSKQQLTGFSTFASKDPFIQQVSADTGTGATVTSSSTAPTSSTTKSHNTTVLTGRTLAHSGAVRISVNGRPEFVRIGASFPRSNPVFRLVSVTRAGVRIGIANGSYSSGAQTVSLGISRMVTLVDSANGARYKLRLLGS